MFTYEKFIFLQGLILDFLLKKNRNFKYNNKASSKASAAIDHQSVSNESDPKQSIDDIVKSFKTIVVDDKNIDVIKSLLVVSASRRMEIVKEPKLDFLEHFPFFYLRPELVGILWLINFNNQFNENIIILYQRFYSISPCITRMLKPTDY